MITSGAPPWLAVNRLTSPTMPHRSSPYYAPIDEGIVDSSDISIIIQGPLYIGARDRPSVHDCVASIGRFFPDAEVIVATWHGENTQSVRADQVVALGDPGGWTDIGDNIVNVARQDASTRAGLERATRRWSIKTRADCLFTSTSMSRATTFGTSVPYGIRMFERPMTILSHYSRDPALAPFLFHPSDLVQFGLTNDLRRYWAGKTFKEAEILSDHPWPNPIARWTGYTLQRVTPEQALMLRWLQGNGHTCDLRHTDEITPALAALSEQTLLTHFKIGTPEALGVMLPTHLVRENVALATLYQPERLSSVVQLAFEAPFRRYVAMFVQKNIGFFTSPYWRAISADLIIRSLPPKVAAISRRAYRFISGRPPI